MKSKKFKTKNGFASNLKVALKVFVILSLFSSFFVFKYDPINPVDEVTGTISSAYKPESKYATATRFIVDLDAGGTANVRAERMGKYEKGKRVVLQEYRSVVFGKRVYRFLRYDLN